MKDVLKKTYLFKNFKDSFYDDLISFSEEETYRHGDIVVMEDEKSNADLFVIVSGTAEVVLSIHSTVTEHMDKTVKKLREYDIFGEISCVLKKRRIATVEAASDLKIIKINGVKFMLYLKKNPEEGFTIMKRLVAVLAERLENLNFVYRNTLT